MITKKKILKLALIAGAVWLIVSLCSCSTSKAAAQTVTAQTEIYSNTTNTGSAHKVSDDSLHRESVKELFRDRSIELTDVTIEYAKPRLRTRQPVNRQLTTDYNRPPAINHKPKTKNQLLTTKISIGNISAKENTAATQKAQLSTINSQLQTKHSTLNSQLSANNSQLSTLNPQQKTKNHWAREVLVTAAVLGLLIGYLYHKQKK